jgi:hypothetical protein
METEEPTEKTQKEQLVEEEEEKESDAEEKEVKPPAPKKSKKSSGKKRGPARPFARLSQEVMDRRMSKLQKRIDMSKGIYDKAKEFIVKYERELSFRKAAPVVDVAAEEVKVA